MGATVEFAEVPAREIVYDRETGLFPYSPRCEIDQVLVARLQRSIEQTGFWQPVIIRSRIMEGIAGNHRFLALLAAESERGTPEQDILVPCMLVDCDAGTAVTIALIENEARQGLTDWEAIRTLLKASSQEPRAVEEVFDIDDEVVRQLRLWPGELDHQAEKEVLRNTTRPTLTRAWITTINSRLAEYPDLRAFLIEKLHHPSWVRAQSLDSLNELITTLVLSNGVRFDPGRSWNAVPHGSCMREWGTFAAFDAALREDARDAVVASDGSIAGACPFLRVVPHFVEQIFDSSAPPSQVPSPCEAASEGLGPQAGQGANPATPVKRLLEKIEGYCVDPSARNPDGCFAVAERTLEEATLEGLVDQGVPAISATQAEELEACGGFLWEDPEKDGAPCSSKKCGVRPVTQPGFRLVVRPGSLLQPACINEQCGGVARDELGDRDARNQKKLEMQRIEALDKLRILTADSTLFGPAQEVIDLADPRVLEILESLLVPDWDYATMEHMVSAWQLAWESRETPGPAPKTPLAAEAVETLLKQIRKSSGRARAGQLRLWYSKLRDAYAQTDEGRRRRVTCLALVRSWRDKTQTPEEIDRAADNIRSLPEKAQS